MEYRYQESLSWCIPGFYFLFYLSITVIGMFPNWEPSKNFSNIFTNDISEGMVAMIVFAIPIFSLIMGWMINAWGGYLFRHIMKWPTTNAYNETYEYDKDGKKNNDFKKVDDKTAESEFNIARRTIDLTIVDRFYYRYVSSRNMFTAQLILVIFTVIFIIKKVAECKISDIVFLGISIILIVIFYTIVARDLTTHARYVFLTYRPYYDANKEKEKDKQNMTRSL